MRLKPILTEALNEADPQRDREYRKEAVTAFSKLTKLFNEKTAENFPTLTQHVNALLNNKNLTNTAGWLRDYSGFVVSGDKLDSKYRGLKVVITTKATINKLNPGSAGFFSPSKNALVIQGIDWGGVELYTLKDNVDVFIHEFIHYLDSKRIPSKAFGKIANRQDLNDMASYVSSPLEFNAFFQEALTYLTTELVNEKQSDPNFDFVSLFPDAQHFVKAVNASQDVVKHLNPKYRRKWDKRLAMSYDTIKGIFTTGKAHTG